MNDAQKEALSASAISAVLTPKPRLTLVVPKNLERARPHDRYMETARSANDALAQLDAEVKKLDALAQVPAPKGDDEIFEMRVTRSARGYVGTSESSLFPRLVILTGAALAGAAAYGIGLAYYTFLIAPILAAAAFTPAIVLLGAIATVLALPTLRVTLGLGAAAIMAAGVAFFANEG
ncbi:MAG: hypothetical protein RLZZ283_448 [Candidatus Parcubacteria bacterium]|jgi:hypothetical protein